MYAGGAHHTCYSQNVTAEYLQDFAEMARIEYVKIDSSTLLRQFKNELKWNEIFYQSKK
jgi:L-arabinose isomerase